ncbi:hypothetical protein [Actinomadura sp. 9N215]|uniref:hypothetical protein n=1 Tax=Actinomadura sp. 9N215 TaxID=3375150 RepID=UPI0037874674
MRVRRIRGLVALAAAGGMVAALATGPPVSGAADAVAPDTSAAGPSRATAALVNMPGPAGEFPRNAQVGPTMAVDPVNPNIVAAVAEDLVDMQPCSKEAAINGAACALPANAQFGGATNRGVGFSGIYFSHDSGRNWTQPTYQGLTAAGCDPAAEPCTAKPGPIHTIPNYHENGKRTRGGPSVAFGPVLRNGKFSWANGSRLYVSTIASNLTHTPLDPGRLDGTRAIMVSHIDNPTRARAADQSNWSAPVIVPERTPSVVLPAEDQIWADNAASSRHFGNVYACYHDFQYAPTVPGNVGPLRVLVGVSKDGGQTWSNHDVAPPVNSAAEGYRMACTVRTDSRGVVYTFFTHFTGAFPSFEPKAAISVMKSYDGGDTWTKPVDFMRTNTGCYHVDRIGDRCTEEGPAGTANEPGPSVSIANGAPTGRDATDDMVLTWADGRFGRGREAALLSHSRDRGRTWSAPAKVSLPGDRVLYSAVAIAPDASRMYLTYNAFTTPFSETTADPRLLRGVLRSAGIGRHGRPAGWKNEYIGRTGDARGTSFAVWNYPEFLGYFVSAIATRRYGAGAWTDVSRTAGCPVIDSWRQGSLEADKILTPAPWPRADCPPNFGNSDLLSATTAR